MSTGPMSAASSVAASRKVSQPDGPTTVRPSCRRASRWAPREIRLTSAPAAARREPKYPPIPPAPITAIFMRSRGYSRRGPRVPPQADPEEDPRYDQQHRREHEREAQHFRRESPSQSLGRHRDRERDRHEERQAGPQPAGIDRDRPAARLVDTLEQLGDLVDADDPERDRRQDQPEAIDHHAAEHEGDAERHGLERPDRRLQLADREPEDADPDEHVDRLPDLDLANARQDLDGVGLRQDEVEGALADVVAELLHVRLDDRPDNAAHEREDAEDREELRLRPAVERRCLTEHEREHGEPRPDRDPRLQDLEREVRPVLKLVEGPDPEEQPKKP